MLGAPLLLSRWPCKNLQRNYRQSEEGEEEKEELSTHIFKFTPPAKGYAILGAGGTDRLTATGLRMLGCETPAKIDPSESKKATCVNEAPSAEEEEKEWRNVQRPVLIINQEEMKTSPEQPTRG